MAQAAHPIVRNLTRLLLVPALLSCSLVTSSCSLSGDTPTLVTSEPREREVSREDVERWIAELSNWGRWGTDDRIGALNLIDADVRRRAVALVRAGVSVSMARNVETEPAVDNGSPFRHTMKSTGEGEGSWCTDEYSVNYHGYAHTHMDALCHIFHDGKTYNGFSRHEVSESGAKKLGIEHVKDGIFARAILMDIPRLKGVEYLEPRQAIYTEDLEAWEEHAGVRVSPGDILLIRTGRWARRDEKGPWNVSAEGAAGVHVSCVPWFRSRDIAVLGSDAASDVLPSGVEGYSHPVHLLVLYSLGVHIFDNFDLERVAAECAKRGRWEFLLTTAPLAVPGGTGSPLNPIATF